MTPEEFTVMSGALHTAATQYDEPFRKERIQPYLHLILITLTDMGPHRMEWIDLITDAVTHINPELYQSLVDGPSFGVILRRHYERLLEKKTESEKETCEKKVKRLLIQVLKTGEMKPLLHAVGPVWRKWHQHTNTPRLLLEEDRYAVVVGIAISTFQYDLEVQQRIESHLEFIVDVLSEIWISDLGWSGRIVKAATCIQPENYDRLLLMGQTIGQIIQNLAEETRNKATPALVNDYADEVETCLANVIRTMDIKPLIQMLPLTSQVYYDMHFIPAKAVEKVRRRFAQSIFDDHRYLEKVWTYHREDIQSRWRGKSKLAREEILAVSFPGIHDTFRQAFRSWTDHNSTPTDVPNEWKFAQMNKEDLGRDTNLLSLIHIRATNPPDLFAFIDAEPYKLGYYLGQFRLHGLAGHTMIFRAQNTPETYGKPIPNKQKIPGGAGPPWSDATLWDSGTRAAIAQAAGEGFDPEEGIVVFEVQSRIYAGLAQCCKLILSDDEKEKLENKPHPTKNKVKARDMQVELPWPTAVSEALFYQPAYPLNLQHLINQTESKRFQAEQHLWALREDPSFFTVTIKEVHEHLPQSIRAKKGKGGNQGAINSTPFVEMAIKHAILEAISSLITWDAILNRLTALHETLNDNRLRGVKYNERLPQHVQEECVDLIQLLGFVQAGSAAFLKQCLLSSPRFRLNFERNPAIENVRDDGEAIEVSNATRVIELDNTIQPKFENYVAAAEKARIQFAKGGLDERPIDLRPGTKYEDIYWLVVGSEMHQGEDLDTNSKPIFFDEFRRRIERDPETADVVTDYVQHQLLDMAFVADCYTLLYCFMPWSQTWSWHRTIRKEMTTAQYATLIEPVQAIKEALLNTTSPVTNARPLFRGFAYPFFEERTRENVQVLQRAENALAEFWAWFDGILDGINPQWPPLLANLFRGDRVVTRTPDWVAPADDGNRKRAAEEPPEEAAAPKRARIEGRARAPARAQPRQQAPQFRFPVNRADLDVFHTIFHVPGQTHNQGGVDWRDFRRAMTHIGFGSLLLAVVARLSPLLRPRRWPVALLFSMRRTTRLQNYSLVIVAPLPNA